VRRSARAEVLFEIPARFLHDLRIETHAGELDKVAGIGAHQIDLASVPGEDHRPGGGEIVGQAEFGGEDVHRADREDAERHAGAGDSVDDLIDRAVATGGDDGGETVANCLLGERTRVAGGGGGAECAVWEAFDLLPCPFCPLAARGRVQNDKDFLHDGRVFRPFLSRCGG
jgi:hypothetical protein